MEKERDEETKGNSIIPCLGNVKRMMGLMKIGKSKEDSGWTRREMSSV